MNLVGELRVAVRSLLRRPVLAGVVTITLAVGISATTAVFSFVDAILFEPLPFPNPDRLVTVRSVRGDETGPVSLRDVEDLQERAPGVFVDIAVHGEGDGSYNLSGSGPPEALTAVLCSGNLFSVLGVEPILGGVWPEEFDRKRNHSVVLTHGLWQRRWGGARDVLDDTLNLDGHPGYGIYGVLPAGFQYPARQVIYRSIAYYDLRTEDRTARFYAAVGRLADGVSPARAQEAVDAANAALRSDFPDTNEEVAFVLTPLADSYVGEVRPHLLLSFAAVAILLLIASANVANLLLARTLGRRRELAVRASLGAGRWSLTWQVLVESLLLALVGGGAGVLLARVWVDLLQRTLGADLPPWVEIGVDGRVLAFALVTSVVAGVLAGILPALRGSGVDLRSGLGEGTRAIAGGQGLARGLVVAEVAFAIVLLISAALVVRSFQNLQAADLGFDPDRLLTFQVRLGWKAYEDDAKTFTFWRGLLERLEALPGVEGAALGSSPPFTEPETFPVTLEGQGLSEQQRNPWVNYKYASHGFFDTLRIRVVSGRVFDDRDTPETERVTVVNRTTAERLWPGQDPIGKRVKFGRPDSNWPWMSVIGVVDDARHRPPTEGTGLDLYVSPFQRGHINAYALVRTSVEPRTLAAVAEQAVLATNPDQASFDFASMQDRITQTVWQRRLAGRLFGIFAFLAVVLTSIGLYGLLDFTVRDRHREIGVRVALGASPRTILRTVLRDAIRLIAIGGLIGAAGWLALSRVLRGVLFGVHPYDPWTLAAVASGVVVVALVAAWRPALRAASVDPIEAFRTE